MMSPKLSTSFRPVHLGAAFAVAIVASCSSAGSEAGSTYRNVAGELGMTSPQSEVRFAPDCLFSDRVPDGEGCHAERMSGGVAVGDFDGDGLDDVYFTQLDGPGELWRNEGDGRMRNVTDGSGLVIPGLRANGAGWADVDNDNDQDLYVTSLTGDRFHLFINDGSGRFREEAVLRGAEAPGGTPRAGFSVNFGDIDNDGWIDLHLTEWLSNKINPMEGRSHARLLRNKGAIQPGFFEDVTESAGVALGLTVEDTTGTSWMFAPVFSFGSALVDLDDDGWQDLIVASDFGTTQLFWNDGDGTFTEGTQSAGVSFRGNAMGLAVADFDANGTQDLFFTAIFGKSAVCQGRPCPIDDTGNRLFLNTGNRTFTDGTEAAGIRDGAWGWGTAAYDADNNGTLDLVMTNGIRFDGDQSDKAQSAPWASTSKRLWLGDSSGSFTEHARAWGIDTQLPGSGLAVFDLDGNGALEIVMVHPTAAPSLWRHAGTPGNAWLGIRVKGTTSTSDAHGAVVEVVAEAGEKAQVRHVGAGSHFLGQSTRTVYVGLGPTGDLAGGMVAEVNVRFPATGRSVVIRDVAPGQIIDVVEPTG
jgi:enediyne biosynthesis protein E4